MKLYAHHLLQNLWMDWFVISKNDNDKQFMRTASANHLKFLCQHGGDKLGNHPKI